VGLKCVARYDPMVRSFWYLEGGGGEKRHAHDEVGVLERKPLHVVQEK
jgi:hypothetical protein